MWYQFLVSLTTELHILAKETCTGEISPSVGQRKMGKQVEDLIKIQRKNYKYIKFKVSCPTNILNDRYTVPRLTKFKCPRAA